MSPATVVSTRDCRFGDARAVRACEGTAHPDERFRRRPSGALASASATHEASIRADLGRPLCDQGSRPRPTGADDRNGDNPIALVRLLPPPRTFAIAPSGCSRLLGYRGRA